MSADTPNFSIADDYDPDGDMSASAAPVAEFLTYRPLPFVSHDDHCSDQISKP
jgi:hypothetical protein